MLSGLAWLKLEDVEAGAGVYATRYRRDTEKGGEGHNVGVSADWSNGSIISSMAADDVSQCAPAPVILYFEGELFYHETRVAREPERRDET